MLDVTALFCEIDDFCQQFIPLWESRQLPAPGARREKRSGLCLSEIITIVVLFHPSNYRTFKHYYLEKVIPAFKGAFPGLGSYNRFVELMPQTILPLLAYLTNRRLGTVTGISFIDSTALKVCHNRRIHNHKVFKGLASRGQCSVGWFFGFKLHLIINDQGELLSVALTPGNVDDRAPHVIDSLTRRLFGKLFGDKGYISQELFEMLFKNGTQLITKLKKNMKNKLIPLVDKILLRKRALIESVNDELKNICQIEHSRHRSPANFLVNLIAGLVAYTFLPKKPTLNLRQSNNLNLPAIAL